jgi:hypothetical protein
MELFGDVTHDGRSGSPTTVGNSKECEIMSEIRRNDCEKIEKQLDINRKIPALISASLCQNGTERSLTSKLGEKYFIMLSRRLLQEPDLQL